MLVARRHWRDDAVDTTGLAGSATLSVTEHRVWTQWAVNAMHAQYLQNKHVKYVAVFQNWLRPAGLASITCTNRWWAWIRWGLACKLRLPA